MWYVRYESGEVKTIDADNPTEMFIICSHLHNSMCEDKKTLEAVLYLLFGDSELQRTSYNKFCSNKIVDFWKENN